MRHSNRDPRMPRAFGSARSLGDAARREYRGLAHGKSQRSALRCLTPNRPGKAMKLYEFAPTRSIRVRWTLQELAVDFEAIPVNMLAGEHRSPAFLKINPAGKLPVLVDGDMVLIGIHRNCSLSGREIPR